MRSSLSEARQTLPLQNQTLTGLEQHFAAGYTAIRKSSFPPLESMQERKDVLYSPAARLFVFQLWLGSGSGADPHGVQPCWCIRCGCLLLFVILAKLAPHKLYNRSRGITDCPESLNPGFPGNDVRVSKAWVQSLSRIHLNGTPGGCASGRGTPAKQLHLGSEEGYEH